jgi:hypothetical protein
MKKLEEALGLNSSSDINLETINDLEYIEFIELCRNEALKRNSNIIECPHCKVKGNEPNMYRWHFENCPTLTYPTTFKQCEQCGNDIPRQGIKPFLYNTKKYCNRRCYMESKKGKAPIIMTEEVKKKLSDIAISQRDIRSSRMKENKVWKYSSANNRKNKII